MSQCPGCPFGPTPDEPNFPVTMERLRWLLESEHGCHTKGFFGKCEGALRIRHCNVLTDLEEQLKLINTYHESIRVSN